MFASMGLIAYALYLQSGGVGASPKPIIIAAVIILSALLLWLEFRYALRIAFGAAAAVALYGFYLRKAALTTTT